MLQLFTLDVADLQRAAAMWILKVKETNKISQMAMQGIIQDVTSLFQKYLLDLRLRVKVQLRAKNVSDEALTHCLVQLENMDSHLKGWILNTSS